ncbi:unnamed protein product [Ectocarpus sp. 8 AP-2014]
MIGIHCQARGACVLGEGFYTGRQEGRHSLLFFLHAGLSSLRRGQEDEGRGREFSWCRSTPTGLACVRFTSLGSASGMVVVVLGFNQLHGLCMHVFPPVAAAAAAFVVDGFFPAAGEGGCLRRIPPRIQHLFRPLAVDGGRNDNVFHYRDDV